MIIFWLPLWSLVGPYDAFFFIIIILTIFISISLVVRFKSYLDMESVVKVNKNIITQKSMILLSNPFNIKIVPNIIDESCKKTNDFENKVKISVLSKLPYHLFYFWGVNIKQFHNFMRLNTENTKERLLEECYFDKNYIECWQKKSVDCQKESIFTLECSDKVNSQTLGQSPRQVYPLVVILMVNDEKLEKELTSEDIIFMINVIHVKDEFCPLETNIITRLLKKKNNLVINLQSLYTPDNNETNNQISLCVICQEELVSIALLPCKHTCTCLDCFTKIDKCPLCRSYVTSYFMIEITNDEKDETNCIQSNEQNVSETNVVKNNYFFKLSKFFKSK